MKTLTRLALALTALLPLLVLGFTQQADAATQPYGGCGEAYRYSNSAGAQDCREMGWTIRPRLVVNPHGVVVMSRMPHCRNEDGSGTASACTWNIGNRIDGNGRGLAFWNDRHDRSHYVWDRSPLRRNRTLTEGPAHPRIPQHTWHWATSADRNARNLNRTCIVRDDTTVATGLVAWCPNGN
jgi:hypothetical protein